MYEWRGDIHSRQITISIIAYYSTLIFSALYLIVHGVLSPQLTAWLSFGLLSSQIISNLFWSMFSELQGHPSMNIEVTFLYPPQPYVLIVLRMINIVTMQYRPAQINNVAVLGI